MFGYLKTRKKLHDLEDEYNELLVEYGEMETERWKAEDRATKMEVAMTAAMGVHVGLPYRENMVEQIQFPVTLSVFALRELAKRMDATLLVDAIDNQVRRKIAELATSPRVQNLL